MKHKIISAIFIITLIFSTLSFNTFAVEMADGTYEVSIALWHSEDDKESMAADAVGRKATIEVENGRKTMHITSGEMSMMGIKASLQELRIADKSGSFTDAKIEAKDNEGNPTGFYFVMPHSNEYIMVKVNPHLAIMGNKDIGARIKVDYSTLRLIKPAEEVSTEEESETEVTAEQGTDIDNEETEVVNNGVTDPAKDEENGEITVQTTASTQESVQSSNEDKSSTPIIVTAAVIIVAAIAIILIVKKKK